MAQYFPPGSSISTRDVGDVIVGDDAARVLMEASKSGDDTALQSLLSQPQWIKTILEEQTSIFSEERPRQGPDDARMVSARDTSNFERVFTSAVRNRHAAVLSALMAFLKRQGIDFARYIAQTTMDKMIANEYAWAWETLASADPNIAHFYLHHGRLALYEAVRLGQTDLVAVLLKYGADPLHPVQHPEDLHTYRSSLMSWAASSTGPRMAEMLLEHGASIPGTAALHSAAGFGQFDTMRFLMQRGADVNEVIPTWKDWTPMHFAAWRGRVDSMKWLEDNGARSDLKDRDGKTPAQVLKEREADRR